MTTASHVARPERRAGPWVPPPRAGSRAKPRARDVAGLVLVSLLMVLYPFEHDTGSSNFSLGDSIVLLVTMMQLYGAVRRPLPLPGYTPHALCLALVALASAVVNVVDLEPYFTGTRATLVETLKLIMAALWMCAIFWLLTPRFARRFLQLAFSSVAFAVVTAVGAVAMTATAVTDARPDGPFENSNLFGAYLCLNAFLTLAAHGVLQEYAEQEGREPPAVFRMLQPLLLPFVLPLLLLGILATGSRGALIGMLAALPVSGYVRLRGLTARRALLAVGVIAVLAGGTRWYVQQGPLVLERLVRTTEGDAKGADERLMLWHAARDAFASHPFLGVGYGQFRNYAHIATGENKVAHQTYLSIAAELGVVGVLVFGWLLVTVLRDSLKVAGRPYACVTRAGRGYVVAVLVQGLFANVQHSRALWICFGIIAVQAAPPLRRRPEPEIEGRCVSLWRES